MKRVSPSIRVPVGGIDIDTRAKTYVNQVLNANRLSHGKFSSAFENKMAKLHSRKFAIFMNSGTSALQVALATLKEVHKWKDGDEVLVPALTFIATSNIVLQCNLRPVFVDIDPITYNIDPNKLEDAITTKTRCIIPVHLFGLSAEMEKIMRVARKRNLKVLEDSCEAMFVFYKGKPVASRGDIACFSTYSAHLVTTGVGGLAATNNSRYATVMKSIMNHGRDQIYLNIDKRAQGSSTSIFRLADRRFSFVRMGYSYRATELEAAIGLAVLHHYSEDIKKRNQNAAYYLKHLRKFDSLQLPKWPRHSGHAFMMFPIVIKPKAKGFNRKRLITYLETHGIETRYTMPLLSQPYYKKIFPHIEKRYKVASWVSENGFYIGCHPQLDKKELNYTIKVFNDFFENEVGK